MRKVVPGTGGSRGSDGVIRKDLINPGDGWGNVVLDEEGKPIRVEAAAFVERRDELLLQQAKLAQEHGELDAEGRASLFGEGADYVIPLEELSSDFIERGFRNRKARNDVERSLNDVAFDSLAHFTQNYAAYYAVAIEEANAAGIGINFAGNDYPASAATA